MDSVGGWPLLRRSCHGSEHGVERRKIGRQAWPDGERGLAQAHEPRWVELCSVRMVQEVSESAEFVQAGHGRSRQQRTTNTGKIEVGGVQNRPVRVGPAGRGALQGGHTPLKNCLDGCIGVVQRNRDAGVNSGVAGCRVERRKRIQVPVKRRTVVGDLRA